MRTIVSAAALALILSGAAVAQGTTSPGSTTSPSGAGTKMSSAECSSTWTQLDAGKSGSLSKAQVQSRIDNFSAADTDNDGKLSQSEFMDACQKGLVTASSGTGTGSRALSGESNIPGGPGTSTSPGAGAPGGSSTGGPGGGSSK